MKRYRHRRSSNPANAFPNPLEPGELAVNTTSRQLAVGDADPGSVGAPRNLIAVRYFDVRSLYAAGDLVAQAGAIYKANIVITPGAFNAANWTQLGSTGLAEAPNDGLQYARRSLSWAEVVQQVYGSSYNYMFNAGTVPPPASGGIRFDNPLQNATARIYINYTTNDSITVNLKTYFLERIKTGDTFYVQDKDQVNKWQLFTMNAPLVDNGTYATLPVTWKAGGSDLTAARVIVSREGASVASPIGEAPIDGVAYSRRDAAWVPGGSGPAGPAGPAGPTGPPSTIIYAGSFF